MTNSNAFLTLIKTAVKAEVVAQCTYAAVGSGTATAAASDTALGSEVDRNARQEYVSGNDSVIISGYWNSLEANGYDISEVGLSNGSTSATDTLTRAVFTGIEKNSSTELWIDVEEQTNVTQ